MQSYWERISGFLNSLSSKQINSLSHNLHEELGKCVRSQGWFDSNDICMHLCTELKGGNISEFGLEKFESTFVANENANMVELSDLMAMSRALYLELGDSPDEGTVSASLHKLSGRVSVSDDAKGTAVVKDVA